MLASPATDANMQQGPEPVNPDAGEFAQLTVPLHGLQFRSRFMKIDWRKI
ncbi:hypothetical protein MTO96_046521, partial [Rhipicephalus appendiculatus]